MRVRIFLAGLFLVCVLVMAGGFLNLPTAARAQGAAAGDPLKRTTPEWFEEAKLGIFIHWNAAAIPAFAPVTSLEALRADRERGGDADPAGIYRKLPYAEMYQAALMVPGSATARFHADHYGDMPYDGLVEQFRDEMIPGWKPEAWATLFERAGARYVVLTTKTEDGFLLWPSAHPNPHKENWQSRRDVVGELATAVRAQGLRFATYYSGGVDWTFGGLLRTEGSGEERLRSEAYRSYVDTHWRELIERYRPSIMWNDYSYPGATRRVPGAEPTGDLDPVFRGHVEGLFRFYLEKVSDGVINNRFDSVWQSAGKLFADFVTPEYRTDPPEGWKGNWEVCRGIGGSFGYNHEESDQDYMSSAELIHMFVDIVARGGNLLINVGPTATGEIPWPQAQRLLELGWWLRTNQDAIYGTRPWVRIGGITGEGLEVRYTTSQDTLYAILLGAPERPLVELDLRLEEGVQVSLEGWSGNLPWAATPAGVKVDLPDRLDQPPALSLRFSPASGVRPSL